MKDSRRPCKHNWVYTDDGAWARCTKCRDEFTWMGLLVESEEQMDETVDTKAVSAEAEEKSLDTREVKAKLLRPTGQEQYDDFRRFVASRLNETVVSVGIVMCITLASADLARGVDGFTGKALETRLRGMPDMVFHLMTLKLFREFPEPYGTTARRFYDEALGEAVTEPEGVATP